jgi:hypothetical protein
MPSKVKLLLENCLHTNITIFHHFALEKHVLITVIISEGNYCGSRGAGGIGFVRLKRREQMF